MRHQTNSSMTTFSKIISSAWILILGIIFAIGAVILFVNSGIGRSYIVRSNANHAFKTLTVKQADRNRHLATSYDASKTRPVSAKQLFKAAKYPAQAIGRMSAPSVNIHNPIFKGFGLENQNLSSGVCTVLPDRTMGGLNNYVLAGHYMGQYGPAVLDNLHLMHRGDHVYLTDMHQIYAYSVNTIQPAVDPHDVQVEDNQPGQRTVTLITCSDFNIAKYGFGKHRTIVQGSLTHIYPANQRNLEKYELTNPTKSQHARTNTKGSFFKNLTLNQIVAGFAILWLLLMAYCLNKVWHE